MNATKTNAPHKAPHAGNDAKEERNEMFPWVDPT
jgi:hypothetical protein